MRPPPSARSPMIALADRRFGQLRDQRRQRAGIERSERLRALERVDRRLEPEQHADAAGRDLGPHLQSLGVRPRSACRGRGGSRDPAPTATARPTAAGRDARIISRSVPISSSKSGKSETTCSTPAPASPSARAMPTSSSRAAVSVGVGSPRLVRWFNVRDVVKPERSGAHACRRDAAHLRRSRPASPARGRRRAGP